MELIPILSTIILVATISTFILAVGAYILYKIRERKTSNYTIYNQDQIESEYVEPALKSYENKTYVEDLLKNRKSTTAPRHKFDKIETNKSKENLVGLESIKSFKEVKKTGINGADRVIIPDSRFTKYTFEEYIDSVEDENLGEIKWH
jgi:hypothetical protein